MRSTTTGPLAAGRLALEPAPIENPSAMNISSADTFSAASTLPMMRPGPDAANVHATPSAQIAAIATSVCRENVSGTYGSGMTKNGVLFAAPGMNRSR